MHIHLDAVGGIAGDMFAAALLDTWPELTERVINTIRQAGLVDEVELQHQAFNDGVLAGSKFNVTLSDLVNRSESKRNSYSGDGHPIQDGHQDHLARNHHTPAAEPHLHHHHDDRHGHHQHSGHPHHHGHHHGSHDHDSHGHHQWSELKQRLANSTMPDGVKRHALGIFGELAIAEAKVHGKDPDTVTFHEVGNWDSVADIVAAATLIDALSVQSWSVSPLPIGRGLVQTAHGELPVPAPATTLLLDGFAFRDDGRAGERVTPTGAAILKYLSPASGIGHGAHRLCKTGFGFGNRKLPGMSNVLRVMAFERQTDSTATTDSVGVIQFEIDDQSGEELAATLEHIRASDDVIDATQTTVFGKKGRMMAAIRILTRPQAIESVAQLCFRQSTTLGLRTRVESRHILQRHELAVDNMRVKVAERPGGITAKAEMDDVQHNVHSHHTRTQSRRRAEMQAEMQAEQQAETQTGNNTETTIDRNSKAGPVSE